MGGKKGGRGVLEGTLESDSGETVGGGRGDIVSQFKKLRTEPSGVGDTVSNLNN